MSGPRKTAASELLESGREHVELHYDVEIGLARHRQWLQQGVPVPEWAGTSVAAKSLLPLITKGLALVVVGAGAGGVAWYARTQSALQAGTDSVAAASVRLTSAWTEARIDPREVTQLRAATEQETKTEPVGPRLQRAGERMQPEAASSPRPLSANAQPRSARATLGVTHARPEVQTQFALHEPTRTATDRAPVDTARASAESASTGAAPTAREARFSATRATMENHAPAGQASRTKEARFSATRANTEGDAVVRHASRANEARTGPMHANTGEPFAEQASRATAARSSAARASIESPAVAVQSQGNAAVVPSSPAPARASGAASGQLQPSAAKSTPTDHREMAELAAAESVLTHDPARALSLVQQSDRHYPDGYFQQERAYVAVMALIRLGRIDDAEAQAKRFYACYPPKPFGARIQHALELAAAKRHKP